MENPSVLPSQVSDMKSDDFASPVLSGSKKPVAPKLTVVRAAQLKPCDCDTVPGETPEAEPVARRLLVYVTSEGQQVTVPCSASVLRSVKEGNLDMVCDSDFMIFIDKKANMAYRVEAIKRQDYDRGLTPSELEGVKHVEFDVELINGFATVRVYPAKVDREEVIRMKLDLDQRATIRPGDKLCNRYPVVDVRGVLDGVLVKVNPFVK
jgi:hypothetical protein